MEVILSVIIGGAIGFAAEKFIKADHGIPTSVFIGILGGLVGSTIFSLIGLHFSGIIGTLFSAIVGACLTILIYRAIQNKEQGLPIASIIPKSKDNSDNST